MGFEMGLDPIPAVPVPPAFKRRDHALTKGRSVREGLEKGSSGHTESGHCRVQLHRAC